MENRRIFPHVNAETENSAFFLTLPPRQAQKGLARVPVKGDVDVYCHGKGVGTVPRLSARDEAIPTVASARAIGPRRWRAPSRNFRFTYAEKSAYCLRMEETLRNQLLELARRFGEATELSLSAIGRRALNDNTVFGRLAAARLGFGIKTYDKLVQWFSDNWPQDLEWPEDVPRPIPHANGGAAA